MARDELDPPGERRNAPYVVTCQPGKYAYCQCGKSSRLPMCDGTHRGTDVNPLKVVFDTERTVAWCACGRTAEPPFCDGSHARVTPTSD